MNGNQLTDERLEQLLEVGRAIVSELDPETVLRRVLDAARDLTGAKYAALGVLNEDKTGLERFVHSGIDEQTRRQIGPLPRGRGVLGELIRDPRPLRLADVGSHPRSYGFPPAHPEMKTFLGTPVLVRGEAWGNLYLTEKKDGAEFDDADEQLIVVLAAWSAVAIENARLYESTGRRAAELVKALRGLEAASDVARTVSSGISLEELLELIAKRGRSVVAARRSMVLLSDGSELEIVAAAGEQPESVLGRQISDQESWLNDLQAAVPELRGLKTLVTPLELRRRPRGLLLAIGPRAGDFDADDERVFRSFAASAASTIVTVQAVEDERLKLSIEASERERHRWARELHDETLQELGALRVLLDSGADVERAGLSPEAHRLAIEHVDRGIQNLQGLITELRPAALDDLGVGPAIEALARQSSQRFDVEIDVDVDLVRSSGEEPVRLPPELEATIYRLVQEAMNNAIKHAEPSRISVTVSRADSAVEVNVADDGSGFDVNAAERSFGLIGMEERATLSGGTLRIESEPGRGTEVRAELPLTKSRQAGDRADTSLSDSSRA
ncbi:MAG TPA: GAF domain-containing sensor histidine kinase [Solirubrobacterales bacterium]|nr:GAF domain-containing sensor histidine kinase [Solirubrobacterales bacterium]